MRTDAIIDKRQVPCPNASHLGYDKWRAQVGDLIWYRESPANTRIGRMIGRVHYAPDGWPTLDAYHAWKHEVQLETDATGHPTPKERSNA